MPIGSAVEVGWSGSGGGFSPRHPAFKQQQEYTAHYLANAPGLPPATSYPAGGRGVPDVSAFAVGYQVYVDGKVEYMNGTSASAPMFGGLISLINEARLNGGKPAMGYLNPWIYSDPSMFTDVVAGWNRLHGEGFNCTEGWDPVTGLGTPIFDRMLAGAMAMPT